MDFIEALKCVKEGEAITRTSWKDSSIYCGMNEGMLSIFQNGKWDRWLVSEADLYARDWEVLSN